MNSNNLAVEFHFSGKPKYRNKFEKMSRALLAIIRTKVTASNEAANRNAMHALCTDRGGVISNDDLAYVYYQLLNSSDQSDNDCATHFVKALPHGHPIRGLNKARTVLSSANDDGAEVLAKKIVEFLWHDTNAWWAMQARQYSRPYRWLLWPFHGYLRRAKFRRMLAMAVRGAIEAHGYLVANTTSLSPAEAEDEKVKLNAVIDLLPTCRYHYMRYNASADNDGAKLEQGYYLRKAFYALLNLLLWPFFILAADSGTAPEQAWRWYWFTRSAHRKYLRDPTRLEGITPTNSPGILGLEGKYSYRICGRFGAFISQTSYQKLADRILRSTGEPTTMLTPDKSANGNSGFSLSLGDHQRDLERHHLLDNRATTRELEPAIKRMIQAKIKNETLLYPDRTSSSKQEGASKDKGTPSRVSSVAKKTVDAITTRLFRSASRVIPLAADTSAPINGPGADDTLPESITPTSPPVLRPPAVGGSSALVRPMAAAETARASVAPQTAQVSAPAEHWQIPEAASTQQPPMRSGQVPRRAGQNRRPSTSTGLVKLTANQRLTLPANPRGNSVDSTTSGNRSNSGDNQSPAHSVASSSSSQERRSRGHESSNSRNTVDEGRIGEIRTDFRSATTARSSESDLSSEAPPAGTNPDSRPVDGLPIEVSGRSVKVDSHVDPVVASQEQIQPFGKTGQKGIRQTWGVERARQRAAIAQQKARKTAVTKAITEINALRVKTDAYRNQAVDQTLYRMGIISTQNQALSPAHATELERAELQVLGLKLTLLQQVPLPYSGEEVITKAKALLDPKADLEAIYGLRGVQFATAPTTTAISPDQLTALYNEAVAANNTFFAKEGYITELSSGGFRASAKGAGEKPRSSWPSLFGRTRTHEHKPPATTPELTVAAPDATSPTTGDDDPFAPSDFDAPPLGQSSQQPPNGNHRFETHPSPATSTPALWSQPQQPSMAEALKEGEQAGNNGDAHKSTTAFV